MGNVKVEDVEGFEGSFMELLVKVDDDHTKYNARMKMEKAEVQMLCFGGVGDISGYSKSKREPMDQREAVPAIGSRNVKRGKCGGVSGCSKSKRAKTEASPVSCSARAGKAKLGSHIKALQQLVPPMAKV